MAKLVVWVARQGEDSKSFNLVARTKKQCKALVENSGQPEIYDPIEKIVITYKDAFDLFDWCSGIANPR